MTEKKSRPMYLHGLEGSPQGVKGRWMAQEFNATGPAMPAKRGNPSAFDESYAIAREAVRQLQPNIIVGSSFGGAILMRLVLEKEWFGPTIFLAQAGVLYGLGERLPEGLPAILIHAKKDKWIPHEHSLRLAQNSGDSVKLWTTEGDHKLHHITNDGTLRKAIETLLV